jgi:hypothetical protein
VSDDRPIVSREPDRAEEIMLIDVLRSHGQREGAAPTSYQRLAAQ